jgi:hypothetical protein
MHPICAGGGWVGAVYGVSKADSSSSPAAAAAAAAAAVSPPCPNSKPSGSWLVATKKVACCSFLFCFLAIRLRCCVEAPLARSGATAATATAASAACQCSSCSVLLLPVPVVLLPPPLMTSTPHLPLFKTAMRIICRLAR